MESTVTKGGKGLWEDLYRVLMGRNSVYVTFVVAGALGHWLFGVIGLCAWGAAPLVGWLT